jgi:AbrB family looped-hinge helix DNA binding protein
MPWEIQKIGPKYQVTIPKTVRNQLGLKIGDLMQARVGENHTVVLERKRLVDFDPLEEDLREAIADHKAGRVLGPFATARDTVKALHSSANSKVVATRRTKKSVDDRLAKSAAHASARHR